jgi:enoyl-CoA hydratase/carnithine racemase
MDDYILKSEWDGVLELVFNRPEKLNAITHSMFKSVRASVDELRRRSDLRVMLIRGKGRYFSAGADLTEGGTPDFEGSPSKVRTWMRTELADGMHALYEEMERVEKPIVVAHHATCVGGGLEMSLSCDFRLAAKSANYWFPEMQMGMLVSAEDARIMGLVHKVYPDETFEEEVRAFCRKLAAFPLEVVTAGKLAVDMAQDLGSEQARHLERLVFSSLTFIPDKDKMLSDVVKKLKGK